MKRLRAQLSSDPQIVYMVGRLIGCSEMLARYMQIHGDDKAQEMGKRADDILEFFYEPERK